LIHKSPSKGMITSFALNNQQKSEYGIFTEQNMEEVLVEYGAND